MVSGFIGNEVPRKGLRVRVPCPPLKKKGHFVFEGDLFSLTRQFATGSGLFHADHAIPVVRLTIWIRRTHMNELGPGTEVAW